MRSEHAAGHCSDLLDAPSWRWPARDRSLSYRPTGFRTALRREAPCAEDLAGRIAARASAGRNHLAQEPDDKPSSPALHRLRPWASPPYGKCLIQPTEAAPMIAHRPIGAVIVSDGPWHPTLGAGGGWKLCPRRG